MKEIFTIEKESVEYSFMANGTVSADYDKGGEMEEWGHIKWDEIHPEVVREALGELPESFFEARHLAPEQHLAERCYPFNDSQWLEATFGVGLNPLPKARKLHPEFKWVFSTRQSKSTGGATPWSVFPDSSGIMEKPTVVVGETYTSKESSSFVLEDDQYSYEVFII